MSIKNTGGDYEHPAVSMPEPPTQGLYDLIFTKQGFIRPELKTPITEPLCAYCGQPSLYVMCDKCAYETDLYVKQLKEEDV